MLICVKRLQVEVIMGDALRFCASGRHWIRHGDLGLGLGLGRMGLTG